MARKGIQAARSFNTLGLFKDHETDWLFKRTLEYAGVGCAEIGECLVAAGTIDERDAETWIRSWSGLAARVEAHGEESLRKGRTVSARGCFLRAMSILWCRDRQNTWQTELAEGRQPELLRDTRVDVPPGGLSLKNRKIKTYDPWSDTWNSAAAEGSSVVLPGFTRSLVIRIE
jgi:hypothetical protein